MTKIAGPNELPTRPGMTSEDFIVHAPDLGFRYPFTATQPNFAGTQNYPWQESLPEACRNEHGIYVRPDFNLAAEVAAIPGPIVEMAGPTRSGYKLLDGIILPTRPFITNFRGNPSGGFEGKGSASLTAIDRLILDSLADVRAFPVADESVGMVLFSAVVRMDEEQLRASRAGHPGPEAEVRQARMSQIEKIEEEALKAAELHDTQRLADLQSESPLIAAMLQSARILKPGGLLLARALHERGVATLQALGLELVMHVPAKHLEEEGFTLIEEAVFRKPGAD